MDVVLWYILLEYWMNIHSWGLNSSRERLDILCLDSFPLALIYKKLRYFLSGVGLPTKAGNDLNT